MRPLLATLMFLCAPAAAAQTADLLVVRADASAHADTSFSEVLRARIKSYPADGTWSASFDARAGVNYKAIAVAASPCLAPLVSIAGGSSAAPGASSTQSGDFAGASFRQSNDGRATVTLHIANCGASGDLVEIRLLAQSGVAGGAVRTVTRETRGGDSTPARVYDPSANGRATIAMALNNMANGSIMPPPNFSPPQPTVTRSNSETAERAITAAPPPPSRSEPRVPDTPPSPTTASGYQHHQELVATKCLTFHGPIDIYGEQVTNNCTYSVAYAFCVVHATNTALGCKSGDDISAGADTIGGGKTGASGWLTPQPGFRTFWIACRGTLGSVQPVLTSTESGKCMSY